MENSRIETWNEETDVVVIGSGFAGLSASIEAARVGSDVVVLEKMSYTGGNSRIAGGGYCCWDSKLKLREKLGLGEDSWESHYHDTMKAGQGYNDPALVEVLAKEAPAGLDFLVDAGIPMRDSLPRPGGHSAYRSYQIACTGDETIKKLEAACMGAGNVEICKKTAVTGFVRQGDGPVDGVTVETDGATRAIRARKAVIICTGGFSQDVALRTSYKPSLTDAYSCTNHKGATGEIVRFAKAVGADTAHMEFVQLYPCADPKTGGIDQGAFLCYSGTGYGLIYTDATGRRFVNELATREVVSSAQIERGTKPTYSILNDEIFAKLGIGPKDVDRLVSRGRAIKAATLGELSEAMGFDTEAFTAAIDDHNAAIESGVEAPYGKPTTSHMVKLERGDFYAIPQWPSVHYTMGGIRIDPQARVLDIWGNPIPHLYAAGECCGGLHGIDRLAGNGIAECVVFGRIAGQLG